MLNCPYHKFGCKTIFIKKNLNNHLMSNFDDHNFIIIDFYEKFQTSVQETINKSRQNTEYLIEKISGAEKKLTELTGKMNNVDNDGLGKKLNKSNFIKERSSKGRNSKN